MLATGDVGVGLSLQDHGYDGWQQCAVKRTGALHKAIPAVCPEETFVEIKQHVHTILNESSSVAEAANFAGAARASMCSTQKS